MSQAGFLFSFTLLIYNYSHYSDINCFRYKQLDQPADAYTVFLPGEEYSLLICSRPIEGVNM